MKHDKLWSSFTGDHEACQKEKVIYADFCPSETARLKKTWIIILKKEIFVFCIKKLLHFTLLMVEMELDLYSLTTVQLNTRPLLWHLCEHYE